MKRKFKKGEEYIDTILSDGPHLIKITHNSSNKSIGFKTVKTKGKPPFFESFGRRSQMYVKLIKATKLTKTIYGLNNE